MISREKIEKLRQWALRYANSRGYKLNPNEEIVEDILRGLIKNEEKYGYRYCPCRILTGNRRDDSKKICPCRWHRDEIKERGHCHCGLFVSEEFWGKWKDTFQQ